MTGRGFSLRVSIDDRLQQEHKTSRPSLVGYDDQTVQKQKRQMCSWLTDDSQTKAGYSPSLKKFSVYFHSLRMQTRNEAHQLRSTCRPPERGGIVSTFRVQSEAAEEGDGVRVGGDCYVRELEKVDEWPKARYESQKS